MLNAQKNSKISESIYYFPYENENADPYLSFFMIHNTPWMSQKTWNDIKTNHLP